MNRQLIILGVEKLILSILKKRKAIKIKDYSEDFKTFHNVFKKREYNL